MYTIWHGLSGSYDQKCLRTTVSGDAEACIERKHTHLNFCKDIQASLDLIRRTRSCLTQNISCVGNGQGFGVGVRVGGAGAGAGPGAGLEQGE